MEQEKKVVSTLVNAQQENLSDKVEGYCGRSYSSGTVSCGTGYSSGGTSSTSEELEILI